MSEKIYACLLRLYPAAFRKEYGEAMRQVFRDRVGAERSAIGRIRLWIDVLCDCAVSLPREYWRPRKPATLQMEGYRLSEEALARMHHGHHAPHPFLPIACVMLIGLLGVLGNAPRWPLYGVCLLFTLFTALPVLASRRVKRHWRGYELILESDQILEMRDGAVTLVLLKTEIARLLETPDLGLAILTGEPSRSIWAPSALSGYDELRERLSAWAPLERNDSVRGAAWHGVLIWFWPIYASALLVRSLYVLAPLVSIAAAALLLALGFTLFPGRKRTVARPKPSPLGMAIPLVMLALLAAKVAFLVR